MCFSAEADLTRAVGQGSVAYCRHTSLPAGRLRIVPVFPVTKPLSTCLLRRHDVHCCSSSSLTTVLHFSCHDDSMGWNNAMFCSKYFPCKNERLRGSKSYLILISCGLGFWRRVVSYIDANIVEKHAVSIFRVEVTELRSGGFV
jgi:hypothetical protein